MRADGQLDQLDDGKPVRPPLLTSRLRLRAWTEGDVDAVFALLGSNATMGSMRAGRVHSRDEAAAWLRRRIDQHRVVGLTMWALEQQADDRLVGACGLFPQGESLELAYIVDHRFRGRGYATEAAIAVVTEGAQARPGSRIYATIRPGKAASQVVAERSGLRPRERITDDFGDLLVYER